MRFPRLVRPARDEDELREQRKRLRVAIPAAVALGAAAGLVVGVLEVILDWNWPRLPQTANFWIGLALVALVTIYVTLWFARTRPDVGRAIRWWYVPLMPLPPAAYVLGFASLAQ